MNLQLEIPSATSKAHADDVASVVTDFFHSEAKLKQVFDEFADMSGRVPNLPKTVVIPLWHGRLEDAKHQLRNPRGL